MDSTPNHQAQKPHSRDRKRSGLKPKHFTLCFPGKADSTAQANMHKTSPVPEPIRIKSSILFSMFFVLMHIELLAMEMIPSFQTVVWEVSSYYLYLYSTKSLEVETSCCAFVMIRGRLLLKPPMFLSKEWNVPRRLLIMTLKGSFMVKCQQSAHCSGCFWTVDSIRGIWTLRVCILVFLSVSDLFLDWFSSKNESFLSLFKRISRQQKSHCFCWSKCLQPGCFIERCHLRLCWQLRPFYAHLFLL